jgi:hypothetical protein
MMDSTSFILLSLSLAFCDPFCHGTTERILVQSGQVAMTERGRDVVSRPTSNVAQNSGILNIASTVTRIRSIDPGD